MDKEYNYKIKENHWKLERLLIDLSQCKNSASRSLIKKRITVLEIQLRQLESEAEPLVTKSLPDYNFAFYKA